MDLLKVPNHSNNPKKSEQPRGRVSTLDVRPSKLNSDKTVSMMFDASNVESSRRLI